MSTQLTVNDLISGSDVIKYLKQKTQLCKVKGDEGKVLSESDEGYQDKLTANIQEYFTQLATTTKDDLKTSVIKGIKKANSEYISFFWIYVILAFVYLIYTFSLSVTIDSNDGKTNEVPKWATILYIVFGVSLIWVAIVLILLFYWLVTPRVCNQTNIYFTLGLIALVSLYVILTQFALVGPLIREELFAKGSEFSFKYFITNLGTWLIFALVLLFIIFIMGRTYYNREKKNKSNKANDTQPQSK